MKRFYVIDHERNSQLWSEIVAELRAHPGIGEADFQNANHPHAKVVQADVWELRYGSYAITCRTALKKAGIRHRPQRCKLPAIFCVAETTIPDGEVTQRVCGRLNQADAPSAIAFITRYVAS